ncbi:MAG: hypothetical protein ACFUZC_12600 [Chthoniobacteraceae bacterium]
MKAILLFLLVVIGPSTRGYAEDSKKATPPPSHTVIVSIDSRSITITTGRHKNTFDIDKNTLFFYEGNRVEPAELKAGMRVMVSRAFDNRKAAAVYGSVAPVAAPAKPQ